MQERIADSTDLTKKSRRTYLCSDPAGTARRRGNTTPSSRRWDGEPYFPFAVNTFTGATGTCCKLSWARSRGIGRNEGIGCDWQQHELSAMDPRSRATRVSWAFMVKSSSSFVLKHKLATESIKKFTQSSSFFTQRGKKRNLFPSPSAAMHSKYGVFQHNAGPVVSVGRRTFRLHQQRTVC